jgi:hypothetical protein
MHNDTTCPDVLHEAVLELAPDMDDPNHKMGAVLGPGWWTFAVCVTTYEVHANRSHQSICRARLDYRLTEKPQDRLRMFYTAERMENGAGSETRYSSNNASLCVVGKTWPGGGCNSAMHAP